ncbi:MAG: dihydroorotase, partial [Phascolarctobacterium sp.]|nr:dihydroorotase [Phascolarctobacterium sp.]
EVSTLKILIKNGRVVDPSQNLDKVCDLLVEDGKVKAIGENLAAEGAEVYDATDKVVAPGLIDMHTHLREPGLEAKEDIVSGTKAAAAGGVTTVACMPNTKPVIDSAVLVSGVKQQAEEESYANVEVIGAISKGEKGEELAEMGDMAARGALGFSDDGHYVKSSRLFLLAARYIKAFDKPLLCHAIDPELNAEGYMHEGVVSARIGVPGIPYISEDIAVARDCIIAEYTGAHVHICHVASKGAIDIIRQAQKKGVNVTCEVAVQHLTLTDEACADYNPATRVSPPLRSMDHVEAMRQAVLDGTVNCIVTDHAPHAPEEKDVEFRNAPNGFCGLETSLGVVLTDLYHTGIFDLNTVINKMSCEPAKVFKLEAGTLKEGAKADITIMDLNQEWTVDSSKFYTRGKFTPYEGKACKGKAVATILGGKFVMKDGVVICK